MRHKLYIIGTGPGCREFSTQKADAAMRSVDRVLGTSRVAELYERCESLPLSELLEKLDRPFDGSTAVLVSGDTGFFSVASRIDWDFSERYDIERIPGIGSVSYFSAKIGTAYEDARLISLHGRRDRIVPYVAYNRKTFALTGGSVKAHDLCRDLFEAGMEMIGIVVGENLSYPEERILRGTPESLKDEVFDGLAVVYFENQNAVDPHVPLRDGDFIRSETIHVPMTKEEVRWLAIAKLRISPKDVLYDIGSGTGSVAIEMARKACEGAVYVVESREEAVELIRRNRIRHGAYNISVKLRKAPDCLAELPAPDKAFIGGSSGEVDAIVKTLSEINPAIRIVATAISPQSLHEILEAFEEHGLHDIETICVNVAKSKRVGRYDIMSAQNPVYIVSGGAQ